MAASLAADGFTVVGESAGLRPVPRLERISLLIFEFNGANLREVVRLADGHGTRLVATVRDTQTGDLPRLLDAGVRAILRRDDLTAELLASTLRTVAAGSTSAPTELLLLAMAHARVAGQGATGALTDREREVLRWLAEGSDTLEIALGMSFSERTVKNVVHDIMMKLNCRTRAHAVAMATRSGVI